MSEVHAKDNSKLCNYKTLIQNSAQVKYRAIKIISASQGMITIKQYSILGPQQYFEGYLQDEAYL